MTEITKIMKITLSWLRGNPSSCGLTAIAISSAVVRITQMAHDLEAAA